MSLLRRAALALPLLAVPWSPAAAQEPAPEDAAAWLARVEPLLLPEERELYPRLDAEDQARFREIFWARRDPDPEGPSPDNAFRAEYLARLEEAQQRFQVAGETGLQTDCGLVYVMLGEPAERRSSPGSVRSGPRTPEDWIYRGEGFAGGETTVFFDETCSLPASSRAGFLEQLAALARSHVTWKGLGYPIEDGRLASLADQLPKRDPTAGVLEGSPQDFALEAETKLMMRSDDGATYVGGLLRGEAEGLGVREEDGRRLVDLAVVVEATTNAGQRLSGTSMPVSGVVGEDGWFECTWPLTVPGGTYTVRLGVVDRQSEQASVTRLVFEAPDFDGAGLAASPLVLFEEMTQKTPQEGDPYAALTLGSNQLSTRFGDEFLTSDSMSVIAFVYGAEVSPETGAAELAAVFEVKNAATEVLSRSPEQLFEKPEAVVGVGPVLLAGFAPGEYTVELLLEDRVAAVERRVVSRFTVAAPAEAAEPAAAADPGGAPDAAAGAEKSAAQAGEADSEEKD